MRRIVFIGWGLLLASASALSADGWDLTLYGGAALPRYEQTFRFGLPDLPNLPNVEVTSRGDLVLDASGGSVFGGALARRLVGPLSLEGRLDTATVTLETEGAGYGLSASIPPFPPVEGSLTLSPGTFPLKRLTVLSLNARLETGGPVSLFLSGGVSYLPSLESEGTVAATLAVPGLGSIPALSGDVRLEATPTESKHRFGANAGAGLRIRLGGNVSLLGEARVFGFREYELAFTLATSPSLPILGEAIAGLDKVRFDPVYFHAAAGLTVSF
jgi:opacity protein-like surface antigen